MLQHRSVPLHQTALRTGKALKELRAPASAFQHEHESAIQERRVEKLRVVSELVKHPVVEIQRILSQNYLVHKGEPALDRSTLHQIGECVPNGLERALAVSSELSYDVVPHALLGAVRRISCLLVIQLREFSFLQLV